MENSPCPFGQRNFQLDRRHGKWHSNVNMLFLLPVIFLLRTLWVTWEKGILSPVTTFLMSTSPSFGISSCSLTKSSSQVVEIILVHVSFDNLTVEDWWRRFSRTYDRVFLNRHIGHRLHSWKKVGVLSVVEVTNLNMSMTFKGSFFLFRRDRVSSSLDDTTDKCAGSKGPWMGFICLGTAISGPLVRVLCLCPCTYKVSRYSVQHIRGCTYRTMSSLQHV